MANQYEHMSVDEACSLDFGVEQLGECNIESPVKHSEFIDDDNRILFFSDTAKLEQLRARDLPVPSFERAGPRRTIYHDPAWTRVAIVTCGGLCPGINDVIKSLVNTLYFTYGVDNVYGIRYGYRGLVPTHNLEPITLTPESVDTIHENGGSILGSSRGPQSIDEMVRTLDRLSIGILFTIGGDGTQRGAHEIANAAKAKGVPVSVIGIPKTVDNDLSLMDRTFGFETAVYASGPIIGSAHDEAKGAYNGIGLVKLMGRHSGFIAASAVLANSLVNFCLIPEVPFELEGDNGFLRALERRLDTKNHAVIVVAEGAGQHLFGDDNTATDASGNVKFHDIGAFLQRRIGEHLRTRDIEHAIKYFDPSYLIRSVPARGTDAIFCLELARHAVHAAMAGKTDMVTAYWHGEFVNMPIELATREHRQVNPTGQLWRSVNAVTQQRDYWDI